MLDIKSIKVKTTVTVSCEEIKNCLSEHVESFDLDDFLNFSDRWFENRHFLDGFFSLEAKKEYVLNYINYLDCFEDRTELSELLVTEFGEIIECEYTDSKFTIVIDPDTDSNYSEQ